VFRGIVSKINSSQNILGVYVDEPRHLIHVCDGFYNSEELPSDLIELHALHIDHPCHRIDDIASALRLLIAQSYARLLLPYVIFRDSLHRGHRQDLRRVEGIIVLFVENGASEFVISTLPMGEEGHKIFNVTAQDFVRALVNQPLLDVHLFSPIDIPQYLISCMF
jgi:hypothetical protein